MATCPVCSHDVKTPFFLNADAWRWLVCPHCSARLEQKNRRFWLPLVSLFLVVIPLGRLLGPKHIVLAEGLVVATSGVMLVMVFLTLIRPQLQVRKPPQEPATTLKINN